MLPDVYEKKATVRVKPRRMWYNNELPEFVVETRETCKVVYRAISTRDPRPWNLAEPVKIHYFV